MEDFDIVTSLFVYYKDSVWETFNADSLKRALDYAKKNNMEVKKVCVRTCKYPSNEFFGTPEIINELDITKLIEL